MWGYMIKSIPNTKLIKIWQTATMFRHLLCWLLAYKLKTCRYLVGYRLTLMADNPEISGTPGLRIDGTHARRAVFHAAPGDSVPTLEDCSRLEGSVSQTPSQYQPTVTDHYPAYAVTDSDARAATSVGFRAASCVVNTCLKLWQYRDPRRCFGPRHARSSDPWCKYEARQHGIFRAKVQRPAETSSAARLAVGVRTREPPQILR